MINVHDANDDENREYLDAGGTGLSPETISQLKFLKCFGYLCSLQIVVATINGVYRAAESYFIPNLLVQAECIDQCNLVVIK